MIVKDKYGVLCLPMTVMASPAAPKPSSLGSEKKRFFVGNLFPDANQSDLEKLFSKFGSVVDVEIKNKKDPDGNVLTTFAFVNCSGIAESRVQQCIRECNGLKWKGKVVKVRARIELTRLGVDSN